MAVLFQIAFLAFFTHHPVIGSLGGYYLFSNLVGSMEEPSSKSGAGYRYLYRFTHGLAGNLKYALTKVYPSYVEPSAPAPKPS